jgi:hypothetical protein
VAGLLRAEVVADGRLADPAALLDDDGAPDPERIKAAVSALLAGKPHYAKRISGDVGQGARPGQPTQRGAVEDHPVPGRASRRRDGRIGSGISMIGLSVIGSVYT